MKRSTRAAAVIGLTVALGGLSAPAAMADINFINVGPSYHSQSFRESGPGDLGYTSVKDSKGVKTSQLDKSVEAGDLVTKILGNHAQVTNEVEGAEQDQGERP
ncbi:MULTISPECIES: hypothetical protein [unclassified Streptomyces]|uniref:hypothetical protein n=1 Tax=unclassified Streptomyces TaxID=2593676 RepID=UPI002DDBC5A4|nr:MULTISPECIES: hypothetical protein [unclassified Streptomyces]WSA92608.1 hypothetical protein OIE63_14345 [Streptomyces sp. NBC_01795]WSB76974.1 hypothetical protein OHB04_15150 [Streptomyces sp. NBC_01775]WSS14755.1 hypothetical protein OG533_24800 [Streptomyces sp. NBC_01186]WSS43588.1 hypothetical protein OG220_25565 [Streptomyces sp. NBC_01187]